MTIDKSLVTFESQHDLAYQRGFGFARCIGAGVWRGAGSGFSYRRGFGTGNGFGHGRRNGAGFAAFDDVKEITR